jgi:hypothetical protein
VGDQSGRTTYDTVGGLRRMPIKNMHIQKATRPLRSSFLADALQKNGITGNEISCTRGSTIARLCDGS